MASRIIRSKILAADGYAGVAIMLAYYAGGTNMFPLAIGDVSVFLISNNLDEKAVLTDLHLFDRLVQEVASAIEKVIGECTPGSFEQYMSLLRHGWRANRSAPFPQVKNQFSKVEETIAIYPRDYAKDFADGTFQLAPDWVRNLEVRP